MHELVYKQHSQFQLNCVTTEEPLMYYLNVSCSALYVNNQHPSHTTGEFAQNIVTIIILTDYHLKIGHR